jgi:AAA domain-containing protein
MDDMDSHGNGHDPKVNVERIGTSIWVCSGEIRMEFGCLASHRDGVSATLVVTAESQHGDIFFGGIKLDGANSRRDVASAAGKIYKDVDWNRLLLTACREVYKIHRQGKPAVLVGSKRSEDAQYLVEGLILRGQMNVLYGDGESCKSILTMATLLAGSEVLQRPLSGRWTVGPIRRAIFLDWESDLRTFEHRVWQITGRELSELPIVYMEMALPLADDIDRVRAEVDRYGADVVVIDSIAMAAGEDPEGANAAVRLMGAIRMLGPATKIGIGHQSKAETNSKSIPTPFGSVFYRNLARSTVWASAEREDSITTVTLTHTKNNDGPRAKPTAIRFTFDPDGRVTCSGTSPDLSRAGLGTRILDFLKAGPATVSVIAEALGEDEGSVKSRLHRMKNRTSPLVMQLEKSYGGQETLWALIDRNRTT